MNKEELIKEVTEFIQDNIEEDTDGEVNLGEAAAKLESFVADLDDAGDEEDAEGTEDAAEGTEAGEAEQK